MSQQTTPITLSIIVPIRNAASTLRQLHRRIATTVAEGTGTYEIILIDDGSSDGTWQVASDLAALDPSVTIARMALSVGQHRATLAAMLLARGDTIVTLDDDLQHPPESIPSLIDALHGPKTTRVVFAQPGATRTHARWRRAASVLLNPLFSVLLRKPRRLRLSAFRAMDRTVIDELVALRIPRPVVSPMLFRITHEIAGVSVPAGDTDLRSRYTLRGLMLIGVGYVYAADPRRLVFSGMTALGTGAGLITAGTNLLTSPEQHRVAILLAFVMIGIGTVDVAFGGLCSWVWGRLRVAARIPPNHPMPIEIIGNRS